MLVLRFFFPAPFVRHNNIIRGVKFTHPFHLTEK